MFLKYCNVIFIFFSVLGSKKIVREHCLVITTKKNKKYILQAPTEDEMKDWVRIIESTINKYQI